MDTLKIQTTVSALSEYSITCNFNHYVRLLLSQSSLVTKLVVKVLFCRVFINSCGHNHIFPLCYLKLSYRTGGCNKTTKA